MMSLKRSYAQASAPSPSPNVTSLAPPPVNTAVATASASASATSASASLTATLTPPAASTATSSSSLLPPNLITDPSLTLSLQRYLQRRQYHPSCPEKTLSVQEFALKSVLGNEASGSDAVGFTCVSADAAHVDQQYSKFKIWISESPDHFKPELAQLLYPTFTHLYLELVASGQKVMAQKFHKRHHVTFQGNAEFSSFIRQLSGVSSAEAIAADAAISAYRTSKYRVTLSAKTFHYLSRYLQSCGGLPVLVHVLTQRVDLRLADALGACSTTEARKRVEKDKEVALAIDAAAASKSTGKMSSSTANDTTMPTSGSGSSSAGPDATEQRLRETICTVRDGSSPLPNIAFYKVGAAAAPHPLISANVSADGRLVSVTTEDAAVSVWSLLPRKEEMPSESPLRSTSALRAHQRLLLGCDFGDEQEEAATATQGHLSPSDSEYFCLRGHAGPVYASAFVPSSSPNSEPSPCRHLLSCGADTTVRIWDVETLTNRAVYQGHTYPVWCLDVNRLGTNAVTGSMDRTAKLWHLEYTYPIRIFAGHEKDVDVIRWHPNCNYFATGSVDKSVRMWSHADAKMVRVFSGHRGGICALSFSPDGKMLATGGEDKRIRIWDLAASNVIKELKGHTDTIYSLAWSPDSSLLSSGAIDGTLKLWDVKGPIASAPVSSSESVELVSSYSTGCSCVHHLGYSEYNTLLGVGAFSGSLAAPVAASVKTEPGSHNGGGGGSGDVNAGGGVGTILAGVAMSK